MPAPVRRLACHLAARRARRARARRRRARGRPARLERRPHAAPGRLAGGGAHLGRATGCSSSVGVFVFAVVAVPLADLHDPVPLERPRPEVEGPQIRGNSRLEIGWTVGAVLIVTAVIVASSSTSCPASSTPAARAAARRSASRSRGGSSTGATCTRTASSPTTRCGCRQGRGVTFDVTAPDTDVIHSFWVPTSGGSATRSRAINELQRGAGADGRVRGDQCAELCGIQHAKMHGTVIVLPEQEFDAWLAEQAERQQRPDREQGGDQWVAVCSKCHGPDVAGEIGPPLEGNPLLADPVALGAARPDRPRRDAAGRSGLERPGDRVPDRVHVDARGRRRWRRGLRSSATGRRGRRAASRRG